MDSQQVSSESERRRSIRSTEFFFEFENVLTKHVVLGALGPWGLCKVLYVKDSPKNV